MLKGTYRKVVSGHLCRPSTFFLGTDRSSLSRSCSCEYHCCLLTVLVYEEESLGLLRCLASGVFVSHPNTVCAVDSGHQMRSTFSYSREYIIDALLIAFRKTKKGPPRPTVVKHSRPFTFWEQMDSHFHVVVPVSIIAIINGFEKPRRVSFYIIN